MMAVGDFPMSAMTVIMNKGGFGIYRCPLHYATKPVTNNFVTAIASTEERESIKVVYVCPTHVILLQGVFRAILLCPPKICQAHWLCPKDFVLIPIFATF